MHITILGSGTCNPSLERSAAAIKVVDGTTTVLLDSGPGALRQMLRSGTTINDIDLLCYTHQHVDHTADLVPLLFASQYGTHPRTRDLTIMAAPGFSDFYHRLRHAYGEWIAPVRYAIHWIEHQQPFIAGCLTITSAAVLHTPYSIAFRLQDRRGTSMVYSGDTDYCESIAVLARDCDVLILECSFPDGMHCDGHLTPELAGRIAAEARCKKLILTHFYPVCDPQLCCTGAEKYFNGTVIAAHDLMNLTI